MERDRLKIVDVTVTLFKWTGVTPVTYTRQTTPAGSQSNLGLVTIHTDAGIEGHAFLGFSVRPADIDVRGLIFVLKPLLMGRNPLDRDDIFRQMMLRSRAVMLRTIGAIDVALWDLAGKVAGLPIHRLIGTARPSIQAYASSSTLPSIEAYVEQAKEVKALGYRGYKMHPPHDHALHVKLLERVRAAVGDDYALMYDPAMIYDFGDAVRIGRVLERLGYLWFEDPLPIDDMYNYTKLCAELDVVVMPTEYSHGGFYGYAQWITARATDALRGDVAVKGGITACLKGAHLAEGFGMKFELHHGGNSLNNVANLHVALAIGNCDWFEVLLPHGAQKYGLVRDLDIDANGMMALPGDGPGLGAEIDFDLIRSNTLDVLR